MTEECESCGKKECWNGGECRYYPSCHFCHCSENENNGDSINDDYDSETHEDVDDLKEAAESIELDDREREELYQALEEGNDDQLKGILQRIFDWSVTNAIWDGIKFIVREYLKLRHGFSL